MEKNRTKTALQYAVDMLGGQRALARACGMTQPSIQHALRVGRVSAELAVKVHDATKGNVPKWRLRPDLWSEPTQEQA